MILSPTFVATQRVIALLRATLRYDAPVALRGLVLIGIQAGRRAQERVVAGRSAALPYLDEAWSLEQYNRTAVLETWGLLLRAACRRCL